MKRPAMTVASLLLFVVAHAALAAHPAQVTLHDPPGDAGSFTGGMGLTRAELRTDGTALHCTFTTAWSSRNP